MNMGFRVGKPVERQRPLDRFAPVKLRVEQTEGGVRFPAGTRGVIVDVYDDGTCGVEFGSPAEDVLVVRLADLEPA